MREEFPQISVLGEQAILIQFEPKINDKLLEKLLFYKDVIENRYLKAEGEVINTYDSLLVFYHSPIEDVYGAASSLKLLFEEGHVQKKLSSHIFEIPVCYDSEFGPDLKLISDQNKLSEQEISRFHSAPLYTVYFMGFLPGFLYLGGLDERLYISRKKEPRMEVKRGSVGIGEKQTGIYPKSSPGGWQIIGNSPVQFFNKNSEPPGEIRAGDKVKFRPVSREEYQTILKEVERGHYKLKRELYEG